MRLGKKPLLPPEASPGLGRDPKLEMQLGLMTRLRLLVVLPDNC